MKIINLLHAHLQWLEKTVYMMPVVDEITIRSCRHFARWCPDLMQPVAWVPAALACSLIDVDAAKKMPSTAPVTKSLMPNRGLKPASGNQHGLKP